MSEQTLIAPTEEPLGCALTGFDLLISNWIDVVIKYDRVLDNQALMAALQAAINHWPYFSGRKISKGDGRIFIDNFQGLLFESCSSYESYELISDATNLGASGFLCDTTRRSKHWNSLTSTKVALVQIKHTQYRNGSVLGFSLWHPLGDMALGLNFLRDVAYLYRYNSSSKLQNRSVREQLSNNDGAMEIPSSKRTGRPALVDIQTLQKYNNNSSNYDSKKNSLLKPLPTEIYRGFSKDFSYKNYYLTNNHIAILNKLAVDSACQWSDYLLALAWKALAKTLPPDDELIIYFTFSLAGLVKYPEPFGNNLAHPELALCQQEFNDLSEEALAGKLRRTQDFSLIKSLKDFLSDRNWINNYIDESNYRSNMLSLLHNATFGSSVIYNNFLHIDKSAFDFGNGQPKKVDFSVDIGQRYFSLFPFGLGVSNYTFNVALFEPELDLFDTTFLGRLSELGIHIKY